MKKTLLLVSVIASSFSIAQKKMVAITNISYDQTGAINYIDSTANTFNSWQGSFNEFKAIFMNTGGVFEVTSPDDDSRFLVHCDAMNSYSGFNYPLTLDATTTNTLTNGKVTLANMGGFSKSLYAYTAQGQMTMKVMQFFNGVTWDTYDSTIYVYDAFGNNTLMQQYNPMNGTNVQYVDSMFYNAGTNLLNKAVSYYDPGTGTLVLGQKSLISYTGSNIQFLDLYQDNGSGGVDWFLRLNYNYAGSTPTGMTAYLVVNNTPTAAVFAVGTFLTNAQNLFSEYNLVLDGDSLFKYKFEYDAQGFMTKRTDYEADMNNVLYMVNKRIFTYQNTAGVEELNQVAVTVFPNPSTSSISIKSDSPIKTIRVLNLSGQVVMEQNSGELDIQRLDAGTYILQGTTSTGTFTKQISKI